MATSADAAPTYGELIDLFVEIECEDGGDFADNLSRKFQIRYPHISIGRPTRFHERVQQIVAPLRPSLRGGCCLTKPDEIESYRNRIWKPRIRNFVVTPGMISFPEKLLSYGLTEDILCFVFNQVLTGRLPLRWQLKGIPNVEFYIKIHPFIKKWPTTKESTKIAIGKFYMGIDRNFADSSYPYNVYRHVERFTSYSHPLDELMTYSNIDEHVIEVKSLQSNMQKCTETVGMLHTEVTELKQQLESSRKQLQLARHALRDVTNEKNKLCKQKEISKKKISRFQEVNAYMKEELADMHENNIDLSLALQSLETELTDTSNKDTSVRTENHFSFHTKLGRKYSPSIRKLYYTLLSAGVPTIKISSMIKHVLQTFHPDFDVSSLSLPQRSCASYMRKAELKIVGDAQKAAKLCDSASMNQGFHLNSDGTTKNLKKIGAVAINNLVISTNELPDGTADSVVDDISRELKRLRDIAQKLKLPNPECINWTMIVSSTSDSAATQKRINKLIEERREADEEQFGPSTASSMDLIENFCSMHLAVNLRKAFLNGMGGINDDCRQRDAVDIIVHEFCKLFGRYGVPEYSAGARFADFLSLMSHDAENAETRSYYQSCATITLERQIGSRYFVSAANAVRIFFLRVAALHFLKYTGKIEAGNKLESSVNEKLVDPTVIAYLKVDSFMYYHAYADIVMLSKSTDLDKSAFDMNVHYLELKIWFEEIQHSPSVIFNRQYRVFPSEERLYSDDKKVNHRHHTKSKCLYDHLFASREDEDILLPLIVKGVVKMKEKLCTYAFNRLPGGRYWEPDPDEKRILTQIKPTNDLCESILGLNDYLTTAIPNLHQASRSNLISMKKNKAIQWLDNLADEQQLNVIELAVESRKYVREECKEAEKELMKKRMQKLKQDHIRREELREKKE